MKQHSLVDEQRARDIILAYGASPGAWPAEERLAVQKLVKMNVSLQGLLKHEDLLDQYLASEKPYALRNTDQLAKRILAGLPERATTTKRNLLDIIADYFSLRTFVMATASLLFAVAVVLYSLPGGNIRQNSDPVFEQWAWYDITSQELVKENNASELTFMDLIELESTGG